MEGGRIGGRLGTILRVWDGATWIELSPVPIPEVLAVGPGLGTSAILSPDGKYLVVARTRLPEKKEAAELPIHIFDTATKKVLVKTDWKNNGTIHFTADSSRVLFADTSGRCHWIKLPTGQRDGEWTFDGSTAGGRHHTVTSMSADGALLGYNGAAGTRTRGDLTGPAIIDGKTGKVLREFIDGYFSGSQVVLSADGTRAAVRRSTRDAGTYDIVDARSGAVLAHAATDTGTSDGTFPATKFAFTRDGTALVVLCYHSKSAYLFDVNRSGPVAGTKTPPMPKEPVVLKERWNVPVDSEGRPATLEIRDQTIMWGGPHTSLAALDLQSGKKRPAFGLIELTGGNTFFAMDAGRVAKYVTDDKEFRTWDVKTGKTGEKIPVTPIPPGIGDAKLKRAWLSPNGRFHVVARAAPTPGAHAAVPFGIFETDKKVAGVTWVGGSVHFTADSTRVLVAEYSGGFSWITLPSGESEGWIYPTPANGRTHAVTDVSADGLAIGYNGPARSATDTGPCLVDGKSGDVLHRFGKGFAETSPVALSADGRVAAVLREPVENEVTVEVVSVPKGEPIARATITTNGARPTFALSPDARVLIVHDPKAGTLRRFDLPP